jgi:Fe-S-cluster-containing hydrogenase component 2
MTKRILLDMIKLRKAMAENPTIALPEGYFSHSPDSVGLKTIRELAVFRFTCRRCEDAPCINVCPADALEKDSEGIVTRHLNLCISCKSCVTICPFGTIMTDFFKHHRNKDLFHDLNDSEELELFVKACPPGVVSVVESDETPSENIYRLNDKVLIREYLYTTEKQ